MTFQQIMETYGKEISTEIYVLSDPGASNSFTITAEEIRSLNYRFDGALYTSVMRCCDIVLEGRREDVPQSKRVRVMLTASANEESKDLYLGIFNVYNVEYDDSANTTKLTCYDDMVKAMQPYDPAELDLDNPISPEHPITLSTLLSKICTEKLDVSVGDLSNLQNGDMLITSDKYKSNDETVSAFTYRDVLDDIAKCAGCSLAFKSKENTYTGINTLHIIYVTNGSGSMKQPVAELDIDNLKKLKIGEHYGPADTVILSREPQEDNVYYPGSGDHLSEVKLANVQLVENNGTLLRENWLPAIYNAVRGTEYQCYELESFGIAFLNFGDVFKIRTYEKTDNEIDYESPLEYTSIFMRTDMTVNTGINEKSILEMPVATSTDFKAAATTEKLLNQTILTVNKQDGIIKSLVSRADGVESRITQTENAISAYVDWYDENHESDNMFIDSSDGGFSNITPVSSMSVTTSYTSDSEMTSGYRKYTFTPSSALCSISLDSGIIKDYSDLKADCVYNLSFYAKSDNEMIFANTELFRIFSFIKDADGTPTVIPLDFANSTSAYSLSSDWKLYSFTFSLNSEDKHSVISGANLSFVFVCEQGVEQSFYLAGCKLTYISGKSIQAKLDMYVEKDDNNRIVSMLNASADTIRLTAGRLIIDSGNFQLNAQGQITAKAGTIGGWTITEKMLYCEGNSTYTILRAAEDYTDEEEQAHIIMAAGASSLNDAENASFIVWQNGDVQIAGGVKTIWARANLGLIFDSDSNSSSRVILSSGTINGKSLFDIEFRDTSNSIFRIKSSGEIITPLVSISNDYWEISGKVSSAQRDIIQNHGGFVISANGGSNALFLQGNNVWICGRLYMSNFTNTNNGIAPLYVDLATGEISTADNL